MGLDGYPDFSAKQQKFVTYGIIIVLVLLILLILVSHHMLTPLSTSHIDLLRRLAVRQAILTSSATVFVNSMGLWLRDRNVQEHWWCTDD
jgi:hypothetical protein